MTVTLKYYGLVVDITQKKEEILAIEENKTTASGLKAKIENRYKELKNTNYSIAVNQSIVGLEFSIQDQDVIAFLPPFAGG